MPGISDLLLKMRGFSDPRSAMIGEMLGGGAGRPAGAPGAPARPTSATPPGVATPPTGVPTQPAAYQSPPDLLELYSELSDYEGRQRRIDTGLGLLGSAFAQDANKQMVYNAFAGGGGEEADPLALITSLSEQRAKQAQAEQEAAAKQRMLGMLPRIAEDTGISLEQLQLLYDTGGLDETLINFNKPQDPADRKTQVITDESTGKQWLVDSVTGETIKEYNTGLPPDKKPKMETMLVEDKATGRQQLVNKETGAVIAEYPSGVTPTEDQKNFAALKAEGYEGTFEQFLNEEANRKKNQVTINNNLGAQNTELAKVLDKATADKFATNEASVATIRTVQEARRQAMGPGGIISGSFLSPFELEGRKFLADIFGIDDAATANTDTFTSAMKEVVLPRVKQLGTGNSISNADREFIEKAIGGAITLDQEAMFRLLDILEKAERANIIRNNKMMQDRVDATKTADNPDGDPALIAAFQPTPVPDYSAEFLSHINPEDVELLRKGEVTAEEFERMYGIGTAEIMLAR